MRFRGKMRPDEFPSFLAVLQTVAKLGPVAVIQLTPTAVKLRPVAEVDGLEAHTNLRQDMLFSSYRVESRAENCIGLQMNMGNLLKAFKSAFNAASICVKLTQKASIPYLSVDILTQASISIQQDVPVIVMTPDEMKRYAEPKIPSAEVRLSMKDCKAMRSVVERMKGVSKFLSIDADMRGTIVLSAENDTVGIKTFFRSLQPELLPGEEEDPHPARAMVKVDIGNFSRLLSSQKQLAARIIVCIAGDSAFIFHMVLESRAGTVTFYMPIIISDDDVMDREGESDVDDGVLSDEGGRAGAGMGAGAGAIAPSAADSMGSARR